MSLSISEELSYCTVRIECKNDNGNISTGTAFFYSIDRGNDRSLPILITNKHVIAGMTHGKFIMRKEINGLPINTEHVIISISDIQSAFIPHPQEDVDLCAMLVGSILNSAIEQNKELFLKTFSKTYIPSAKQLEQLSAIENILMIGYPNGIWDSTNNLPIMRQGTTATNACVDYKGKKEFMIDAACFPGSSGSPVLIYNPYSYTTKHGQTFLGGRRILLLGVLYAGPQYTTSGEIKIVDVPTFNVPKAFVTIPNNLGLVIKSERILEMESLFDSY